MLLAPLHVAAKSQPVSASRRFNSMNEGNAHSRATCGPNCGHVVAGRGMLRDHRTSMSANMSTVPGYRPVHIQSSGQTRHAATEIGRIEDCRRVGEPPHATPLSWFAVAESENAVAPRAALVILLVLLPGAPGYAQQPTPGTQTGFGHQAALTGDLGGLRTELSQYGITINGSYTAEVLATYQAQVTPWMTLQPDMQYVFHPGGHVVNPDGSIRRDALVFGLHSVLNF
jgi:hypothetical protein